MSLLSLLLCTSVPAYGLSQTDLYCNTPPDFEAGTVPFQVYHAGNVARTNINFTFYGALQLSRCFLSICLSPRFFVEVYNSSLFESLPLTRPPDAPLVYDVQPNSGLTTESTTINIIGELFLNTSELCCRFVGTAAASACSCSSDCNCYYSCTRIFMLQARRTRILCAPPTSVPQTSLASRPR